MAMIIDYVEQIANILKGEGDAIRQQILVASLQEIVDNLAASVDHPGVVKLATNTEAKGSMEEAIAIAPANLRQGAPVVTGLLEAAFAQHYQIAPAAVSATAVHAAIALTESAQEITTGITNPDFPRTVTVKGNASGISGNVVIDGTDIAGAQISDTIALSGSSEVEGVKAFKTVSKITLPAETHAGTDTVSVGIAKKFGIPHRPDYAGTLIIKLFDGSADSGSLTVGASLAETLFALNGTPNGAKKLDLYYLV